MYADIKAAYDAENYPHVLELAQPLARQGDATAQPLLGVMYDKGQGVPQSYQTACQWFAKAAARGNPSAQQALKKMNAQGQ